MSPDWADKPEAVPYSDLSNPQSLNLYGYVNNNPLSRADADGHEDAASNSGLNPNGTPQNYVNTERIKQAAMAVIGVAAVVIAAPEIVAAAGAATTVGAGLAVGAATLAVTGTAVNAVANGIGAITNTNVEPGTNMVTNVTNPVAGSVAIATRSSANGSVAADATTLGKAAYDTARGHGVKNPAEVASAVGGLADRIQGAASTAVSIVRGFFAPAPPPPPTPSAPSF
jgi:hypothetical protein